MKVLTVALALSTAIVSVAAHSTVPGKAFNRFVTIWLENTDYSKAAGDGTSSPPLLSASPRLDPQPYIQLDHFFHAILLGVR